jgi:transcriptional regulator with XRE-family HTH domain
MKKYSGRGDALRGLLSRNIRQFRAVSGLSQKQLAAKAGISVPFLGAYVIEFSATPAALLFS